MAAGGTDRDFKLVTPDDVVECDDGDDVTLRCHLSPETSAVAMEIRWFRETDCVYLYKNGHVTEGRGYEGRVSVDPQELQRGGVSLRLSGFRWGDDRGVYTCQVISGKHMEERRVGLMINRRALRERITGRRGWGLYVRMEISAEERKTMEESVQSLDLPACLKAVDELMDKNKQLAESKRTLKEKEDKLKEKDREMEEGTKEMEEIKQQLLQKNREMDNMKQQLEKKNTEITEKNKQLTEHQKTLQEKEKELKERDIEMGERKSLLHERDKQIEEREKQIRERDKMIEERERQVEERERQLEERERQLEFAKRNYDPDPPPIRRRQSKEEPPDMGGESPGPAPPVSPAVSELRLVLLGGSAAGKRAAGNTILGTHTLTHTSTETQHSESRQGEVAGRRVTLVETPDWFCSGLSEKDMRQDVGLCVRLSAPGPHAFLLVIPVEPSEGEERRMLEKMEDIFGEGCWGHTLILFTHAEGLRERSVEELLQTGSQELQQLVEKCGNRCHLLSVKDRPDDTKITQLLEKIEEMVSGNRERFYSSDTYQEAEIQIRAIERRMQREREIEEKKLREERERREELDKNVQESLLKMEGEIQQHEGEIRVLNERTTELQRKMKEERDEEKKREMERELQREITQREEMGRKLSRVREKREKERREMEERHREEMEEMRESYEREARAEAERNLMKIILPELQKNISITKEKMEGEFHRQMEEKNSELERMKLVILHLREEKEQMMNKGQEWRERLEPLEKELQDRTIQLQDLRTQLQEQEREGEHVTVGGFIRRNTSGWLLHYILSNSQPVGIPGLS